MRVEEARPVAAITGWGLCCALGTDPAAVAAAVDAGQSALAPRDDLSPLPDDRAAVVGKVALRDWLKRRKDKKLMARPSQLLLPCAGQALTGFEGAGEVEDLPHVGAFVGVGREPPDGGDSEAALVASCRDGQLDEELLAGPGRDLYPPLLPLQTLPNMALAHVSIHLGVGGANGAWAGGPEAGLHALRAALHALDEQRCAVALWGSTDSHVDLGNARDERRRGVDAPPGEAAGALRLEPVGAPGARLEVALLDAAALSPQDLAEARTAASDHRPALGACGAGDAAVAVLLAAARILSGSTPRVRLALGAPAVVLELRALA